MAQLEGQARNLVQFAFWSGLRTSELIGIRWQDFDEKKKAVHVRVAIVRGHEKQPKTNSGIRTVNLHENALAALLAQKAFKTSSPRIFTDPKDNLTPLDDQRIRKRIWKPALKAAGIVYREPYQTRHTFATTMLQVERKSPIWVSRQMGHSSPIQTFKSYARWIEDNE